jgi:two-component system, NarL family, nitrate/nitrite response regulator NarL
MQQWRQPVTRIIRILLLGNRAIVRSGLSALIETKTGLQVIGATGDRAEAIKIVTNKYPDIILLYADSEDDLEFLPELAAIARESRILVLSAMRNGEAHERAFCLGARGVLLTDIPADALIKAIERVHAGEIWIGRLMVGNVLQRILSAQDKPKLDITQIAKLSKREREIIPLIGQALKNKEIAARLFLSEATVRHHITSIFTKLGVSNRLDLILRLSPPQTFFEENTKKIAS